MCFLTEQRRAAAPPPTFRYRSVQKMLAAVTLRPRTGSERYTAAPLCRQLYSRSHSGMAPAVGRESRALPGPRAARGRRWQPYPMAPGRSGAPQAGSCGPSAEAGAATRESAWCCGLGRTQRRGSDPSPLLTETQAWRWSGFRQSHLSRAGWNEAPIIQLRFHKLTVGTLRTSSKAITSRGLT